MSFGEIIWKGEEKKGGKCKRKRKKGEIMRKWKYKRKIKQNREEGKMDTKGVKKRHVARACKISF